MSGPNSWHEARAGLKRRKARLNQRNQQIRGLKGEVKQLKNALAQLILESDHYLKSHMGEPDLERCIQNCRYVFKQCGSKEGESNENR